MFSKFVYSVVVGFGIMNLASAATPHGDLGWACRNAKSTDQRLYVRVWHTANQDTSGSYQMDIHEVVDRAIYPVAYVSEAQVRTQSDRLIFQGLGIGVSSNFQVLLSIDQNLDRFFDLPGSLTMVIQTGSQKEGTGLESGVEMVCNRTRLGPQVHS